MQMPATRQRPDTPAPSTPPSLLPVEDWVVRLLIGLSLVFTLVPATLHMGNIGPEVTHAITDGSALRQIQFGSLFLAAAWLAWRHSADTIGRIRTMNPFLGLLVLYCALSAVWSPYPDITIKRFILFAGLVLIGLAVAPPVGGSRQFLRVVMGTLTLVVGISMLVALFLPHVGVDYLLGGAWRGITWQKNTLGSIAGFAVLLWLREWVSEPAHRSRATLGLLLCLIVLVMAKSATAILVTAMGISAYLFMRRPLFGGRHAGLILFLVLLLAAAYALLAFFIVTGRIPGSEDVVGPVTAFFNKSPDLTGRSEIWQMVWIAVEQHPVLGIGYGAFWVGDGGPAQYIADLFGWMPSHSHNGYIDILNELGFVGFGLFIGLLIWHCSNLWQLFRIDREDAAMHSTLLLIILVSNFSETQLLRDVAIQQILFVFSSLAITGRLRQVRAAAAADAMSPKES